MLVYRVEHPDTLLGCHQSHKKYKVLDGQCKEHRPSPMDDFNAFYSDIQGLHFGFPSMDAYLRWIGDHKDFSLLAKSGFRLRIFEVDTTVHRTPHQVTFYRCQATIVEDLPILAPPKPRKPRVKTTV